MQRLAIFLLSLLVSRAAQAQDLTGTWEGTEEGNYMKMVIVKVGDRYVGYTYDTDRNGGWCRANFSGTYYPEDKTFKGAGQGMIAMSGNHVQCSFELAWSKSGATDHLLGIERTKGNDGFFDKLFGTDDGPVVLHRLTRKIDTTEYMRRYIASAPKRPSVKIDLPHANPTTPLKAAPPRKVAVAKPPASKASKPPAKGLASTRPKPKAAPAKPAPKPAAPLAKAPAPAAPKENTAAKVAVPPAPKPAAPLPRNEQLLTLKNERHTTIVQEIETSEPQITIRVYDNGVPDGDSVSILHNEQVVADHRLVAVNYFEFTVRLDDGRPVHDITLIAHNLGSIPPNTASLNIIAGEQRYRLTASTDLSSNAVVRFRYKKSSESELPHQ